MNNKINDGGSAFPSTRTLHVKHSDGTEETGFVEMRGMTLRDWFAGRVIQGMLANPSLDIVEMEDLVCESYQYADIMIAHREKEKK